MTKILKIIIVPLVAFAAPAMATGNPAASAVTNMAAADSSAAAAPRETKGAPAAAKTYCLTLEAATGSRLQQRKCRTKAEWDNLGVDINQK